MRCHEVRRLCGPYLDSELEAGASVAIEQHLESCADCRRVFEAEEDVERRITRVLQSGDRSGALWAGIESSLGSETVLANAMGWRRLRLPALSVVAAVLAGLLALVIWPRPQVPDFARAVARDHTEFVCGVLLPQFTGQPAAQVLEPLGGRLDAAAFDRIPSAPGFRAGGARLCHLDGVPVAWVFAHQDDRPVSVIVLRREELKHFPDLQRQFNAGRAMVCGRSGRFQFAARYVDGHVVCVMADLSREHLEALVQSIETEG